MTATPSKLASHPDVPTLIELLKRQQSLYEHLQSLSAEQATLVAGGQTEPLIALLGQRQVLIDQIAALNRSLDPYRKTWDEMLASLDAAQLKAVTDMVNGVQSLLAQIMEQDEHDRAMLQESQLRVGGELKKVNRGHQAAAAYRNAPAAINKAMNREG